MKVYWLEQAESDVPPGYDWLSAGEAACLEALRVPKRRADWLLGRWTAKRALSIYLQALGSPQPLKGIEVRPAASGAPEVLIASQPGAVTISLSHCDGKAVCAVALPGTDVGCDLEKIEPRSDAFLADYFTDTEQAFIAAAAAADRIPLVGLFWSAKESALKALRQGLRLDTRSVTVRLLDSLTTSAPHEERSESTVQRCSNWRPLEVRYTSEQVFQGWWRQTGTLVRTLVASPAPAHPILLQP